MCCVDRKLQPVDCFLSIFLLVSRPSFLSFHVPCRVYWIAVNVLWIVVFLHCAMCDLLSYYVFFPSLAIICPPFLFLLSTIKLFCAFIFIHNLSAHFDDTCDTLKLESYCWGGGGGVLLQQGID